MDVFYLYDDEYFVWDDIKAASNLRKHHVSFESAAEVLVDPLACVINAEAEGEPRQAAIGHTLSRRLLYVVHIVYEEEAIRVISARKATEQERKSYEDYA